MVVIAGLDPAIHLLREESYEDGWMRGSSPRMTAVGVACIRHINKSIRYETSGTPAGVAAFYFAWGCFRFFVPALRAPGGAGHARHINRSIRCGISGMSAGGIG
jgi:hypothetical protein